MQPYMQPSPTPMPAVRQVSWNPGRVCVSLLQPGRALLWVRSLYSAQNLAQARLEVAIVGCSFLLLPLLLLPPQGITISERA